MLIAALISALFASVLSGCGPNRQAWMQHAAEEQAVTQTADMGTPDQVRQAARAEGAFLNSVATTIYGNLDKYPAQERGAYVSLARHAAEVASGLESISNAQTDMAFANAIFAMCDADRKQAEPIVGQMELGLAGAINGGKIDRNAPPEQRQQTAALLTSFGELCSPFLHAATKLARQ